jgi:hypothetical protein
MAGCAWNFRHAPAPGQVEVSEGRFAQNPFCHAMITRPVLPLASLLLALSAPITWATAPRLANILPAGGQRGTETELVFSGQRLDDTKEVVFYAPGLTVAKLDPGAGRVKVLLKIAPDCPLGEHTMRLRTATGISEVKTFWVGVLTNLAEVEPNNEPAKAQRVPLNSTIGGAIPSEDLDYFLVTAEKGSRLTAEIEGMRLGRGAFDSYIAILDRKGHILQAAEDSALGLQDGIASIVVPETGDYLVQVRETGFAGQEGYHYRVHIGTFPRPRAAFPVAAQLGTKTRFTFVGDAAGDFAEEIPLPKTRQDKYGVFAGDPLNQAGGSAAATGPSPGGTAPTPNWVRVTPFPTALENEPNDNREQAAEARELPVVFNGRIARAGDQDWFRFRAKKGQSVQVTVFARRLRSPLDSVIQVVNAKGSVLGDNDDAAGPDSAINFKPEEDGEYSVLVRDHLRRGGPDFVYCVEVAPAEPSITVKIPEVARNDSQSRQYIAAPRGNRFATLISVKRANAGGDLTFRAEDVPAGMRLLPLTMPGKVDQYPVVFEAESNAPVAGRLGSLIASTTNGITGRFQNDIELVQGPNNTSYYGTRVDHLMMAVTEAAPFRLQVVEPSVPLVQGGSMDLRIVAERDTGFDEPISVRLLWRPPGVSALPDMTIPKGSNSVLYVLNAKGDADLRDWPLVVIGSAKVQDGEVYVSSQPARFTVGEPYLAATIERSGCEPGQSTNIVVKLEQKIPFDGPATIRLVGLSDKFAVPEKQITKGDQEVVFSVRVDPSCQPGPQRNLFCTVAVPGSQAVIPHNVGQGGVFRVVPPRKAAPPDAGRKKVASR